MTNYKTIDFEKWWEQFSFDKVIADDDVTKCIAHAAYEAAINAALQLPEAYDEAGTQVVPQRVRELIENGTLEVK